LDSNSDETTARVGAWASDEDSKLKDAVKNHNGKDWRLMPLWSRVKQNAHQCSGRWHDTLSSESKETAARRGKWTTYEYA
jgi:hypothetical protein